MDILKRIDLVIHEAKEVNFDPTDVPDAKLIKVGETFKYKGVSYKVTKWSKDSIKAIEYK